MAECHPGDDCLSSIRDNISLHFHPEHDRISKRAQARGLNFFVEGYVRDIKVFSHNQAVFVYAKCWRSMSKREEANKLQLEIDLQFQEFADSYCSCKVGIGGRCSHIVGLVKSLHGLKLHNFSHVPQLQSCTSLPQQWHKPRGRTITPVPMNHVTVARPTQNRKRKPVTCQIDNTKKISVVTVTDMEVLKEQEDAPLSYMVHLTAPKVQTPVGDVQLGSFLSYQTRNIKAVTTLAHTQCKVESFPKTSPIKLPTEFQVLNDGYAVADPEKLERDTRVSPPVSSGGHPDQLH